MVLLSLSGQVPAMYSSLLVFPFIPRPAAGFVRYAIVADVSCDQPRSRRIKASALESFFQPWHDEKGLSKSAERMWGTTCAKRRAFRR